MRILCVLAVAILAAARGESQSPLDLLPDPSWATLIESSSRGTLLKVGDNDNTTCPSVYSCLDCTTARVCKPTGDGSFDLLQTIKCTGDRPFCDPHSGSCVSEEPAECGDKDDFVCLSNGKFPDADCKKFHVCINYQSLTFQCAVAGESYNARSQVCEASSPCGTFECTSNQGKKVAHSSYSDYFAFCRDSDAPLVVDTCQGNYLLNATSQVCEPTCLAEGIIADVTDCHFYFKCTKIFIRRDLTYMQRDRLRCPEGQAYSPRDYLCLAENTVEACKQ